MRNSFDRNSFFVWAVVPAVVTALLLWYPFGFTLGAMLEEWDVLYLMTVHPGIWNSFPGNPLSEVFAARPLQILPHFVARAISHDSFEGFHLVLMGAVAMRIIGGASIGYYLFQNRCYAAAYGVLSLVFPADTQQFEFRTFHVSVAVGIMIWAAACTIRSLRALASLDRWLSALLAICLGCLAVLIYEPILTLYLIAPAAILAREGLSNAVHLLRSKLKIVLAWLIGPAINVAYLYYAIFSYQSSYQVNASGPGMIKSIGVNLHYLLDSAAYRIFYDAWVSAFGILGKIDHFGYIFGLAITLVAGFVLLADHHLTAFSLGRAVRSATAGLLLGVAAYLPFMVAESHMQITQRTFIAVAPGGSLILMAVIAWAFKNQQLKGAIAAALVVTLGLITQIYQFDRYTRDYVNVVRPYTSLLADQIDQRKSTHLVFDHTGFGGHLNGMYSSKVSFSPTVRRGEVVAPPILCMEGVQIASLPFANCTLANGAWTVKHMGQPPVSYAVADVQVISIGPDFDSTYRSNLPSWRDQGSFDVAQSIFANDGAESFHCNADSMWGYSGFCRGEGWTDGIFFHHKFKHQNWFAAFKPNPSLIFTLSPADGPYEIKLELFNGWDSSMAEAMRVSINGVPITVKKIDDFTYAASVVPSALKNGRNVIVFDGALSKGKDLGLPILRVALTPKSRTEKEAE